MLSRLNHFGIEIYRFKEYNMKFSTQISSSSFQYWICPFIFKKLLDHFIYYITVIFTQCSITKYQKVQFQASI